MEIKEINPKDCIRWPFSNRSPFEFGDIHKLGLDIKVNGQIEPVIARPLISKEHKYEIIAGSRRWKACLEMGLSLKAMVGSITDSEAVMMQLKENEKASICDYSQGIHFSRLLENNATTIEQLTKLLTCSKQKVYSLVAFAKVPQPIWDAVGNMSKVSSRAAKSIYTLANKGQDHIDALMGIASEIRLGIGAKKIEDLVLTKVLGKNPELAHQKKLVSPEGNTLGVWTKNGIRFEKGVEINQKQLGEAIIQCLSSVSGQ